MSRPRLFESLESRTLLSGDILVVNEVVGVADDFHLMHYTQSGTLISSIPIPTNVPGELSQQARGVTVDQNGNIDIYNGTFSPQLSSYSPTSSTWLANQTLAGWSTINNVSFGGLTSYKNYVFASDMSTANAGAPQGIIRFDITGKTAPVRFATDLGFSKVTVGQDGMLYGIGALYPAEITEYDPNTMTEIRSITLSTPVNGPDTDIRGIAVDAAGDIYTATWGGYIAKYDASGNLLADLHPGGNQSDMTLDSDGQIVTSDENSVVYLTNTSLASITSFKTNQWFGFVTFDHFINVAPATAPTFSALAAPTITYGTATTTLSGQISDRGGIPPGSVSITVNGVTESAPIDATTGNFSAVFDTSKLGVASSPYTITYNYPGSGDVPSALDTSKSLTVTPRALTVTANNASKTYGDADPSFSASYSGFATGENASVLAGTLSFTTNEPAGNAPVGTYSITPSGLSSSNYTITFAPGTLTVSPRGLTVTANNATKIYGDPDPAFSVSYSGFASGDSASSLGGTLAFTTNEPSGNAPVGQYTITPSGLTATNYAITFAPGTLTVTARALTVTANNATKTYGDPDPGFSVSYSGFASGDNAGVLSGTLTFATNEPAGNAPVGTYTITPSGLTSSNYAITYNTGTLNVTPRALTVTANDATKTYGDADPTFSASYNGFAAGDGPGVLGGALVFTTNEPSGNAPVGNYSITPSGLTSANYAISFVAGTLSVTPRSLTVTANNATKTYGNADPAFSVSYSGFAPGEGAGVLAGTLSFTTNEPAGNAPVGDYSITPSGLSSANYSITFLPGVLSVTPRALVVTANNASKTYGDPDPTFSVSYSGFAPGEGSSVLSGTLTFTTNEPAGNAPVGTYAITPGGLTSSNYAITFNPGVLTVTPRALVVTANNASKIYGDPDPAFSVSYSGFAPGENSSVLGGTLAFATNEPSGNAPVGTYAITPSGLTSSNYAISFQSGTLTVTPRALTVTANDATKTYGDPDPAFSASYSGFASGENASVLSGSLSFTTNEPSGNAPVGKYSITPSGVSSANYAITFVPGTLSVTPRALIVTANDASKTYGQADPAFTVSGSGFATGDTLASLGGTLAFSTNESNPLTAPAGTYTITPSGLTSPNYTITFSPGTLTVNRAVTAFASVPSPTVPLGTSSINLSARLQSNSVLPVGQSVTVTILGSGGALATGSAVIQSDGTFTAVIANPGLPVGSYTVQYSYAGDHNFAGATATGSLNVAVVYTVKPLYDTTQAHHSGSTIPIKIEVDNASGQNVSSPDLVVTAVVVVDSKGHRFTPHARGNANPGNAFRYTDHSYMYNLDTTGLAPGKYTLLVSVGNDPTLYPVTFVID